MTDEDKCYNVDNSKFYVDSKCRIMSAKTGYGDSIDYSVYWEPGDSPSMLSAALNQIFAEGEHNKSNDIKSLLGIRTRY